VAGSTYLANEPTQAPPFGQRYIEACLPYYGGRGSFAQLDKSVLTLKMPSSYWRPPFIVREAIIRLRPKLKAARSKPNLDLMATVLN
jgi:hypothetical protein